MCLSNCSKKVLIVFKNICLALRIAYHCQRTLKWLHLTWWQFMIKSIRFQYSNISKVAKMIYYSISDVCLIIFAPNLTVQSLVYDQNLCANFTKIVTSSTMTVWPCPCFDFQLHGRLAYWSKIVWKFKMVFSILIYEFNIYFSKWGGGSYWRGTLRNMVYEGCQVKTCLGSLIYPVGNRYLEYGQGWHHSCFTPIGVYGLCNTPQELEMV